MKKILLTLALLLCIGMARAQNPFEKFGYTPKIGTLSKGKYIEHFDTDSIVQIGSVLFNTFTKKIVGLVKTEIMYSEATLQPEIVSRWLTPDPLSEEFPDTSPYVFTNNNPIFFTDPTGLAPQGLLDDYGLDKDGNITLLKKTDDNYDRLYVIDDDKNIVDEDNYVQVNKETSDSKTIITDLSKDDPNYVANSPWGKKVGAWAKTSNKQDAYSVFKFGSDNTNVEWALQEYSGSRFVIGNSHFSETVGSLTNVSGYDIKDLKRDYHSHPGTSMKDDRASGQIGDQGRASSIIWKLIDRKIDYSKNPNFFIYRPALQNRFQYSPWNDRYNVRAVKKANDL